MLSFPFPTEAKSCKH